MRILLLMPALTGAGAERQLRYLAEELLARGQEVLVAFIYDGPDEWPAHLPAHRLPRRRAWSPLLIADLVRLIRTWRPDIVQTSLPRMDVAGGIAARLARVPFVIREPNAGAAYRNLRGRLRKWIGRSAAGVIANSTGGAAYWRGAMVIRNGVPVDAIANTPPAPRPPHAIAGLYVGRLDPEKNVDVLLRACAEVMAERDLFLTICGDGSQRETLIALARELGISTRVDFAGFVRDPWARQRAADFAALLSDFEGHPNVAGECYAAGTPMILSDIAAHREIASGGEALLVPRRDVAATAAAIRALLDDTAATGERAKRARLRAEEWSIATMAAAYNRAFQLFSGRGKRIGYSVAGP